VGSASFPADLNWSSFRWIIFSAGYFGKPYSHLIPLSRLLSSLFVFIDVHLWFFNSLATNFSFS
jgi:hypothetical protein